VNSNDRVRARQLAVPAAFSALGVAQGLRDGVPLALSVCRGDLPTDSWRTSSCHWDSWLP